TKFIFSSPTKAETEEALQKYKNNRKMEMIINLFTDKPIVPNNQMFIEIFKTEKDLLVKYFSLKLIERKACSKIVQVLYSEIKNIVDCKGKCRVTEEDAYLKGLMVSVLNCYDGSDLSFCKCVGLVDIVDLIKYRGESVY
ncbi:hypothetical protein CDIK_3093, partial [Cucumispora dikerogammari]